MCSEMLQDQPSVHIGSPHADVRPKSQSISTLEADGEEDNLTSTPSPEICRPAADISPYLIPLLPPFLPSRNEFVPAFNERIEVENYGSSSCLFKLSSNQELLLKESREGASNESKKKVAEMSEMKISKKLRIEVSKESSTKVPEHSRTIVSKIFRVHFSGKFRREVSKESGIDVSKESVTKIQEKSSAKVSKEFTSKVSNTSNTGVLNESNTKISERSKAEIPNESGRKALRKLRSKIRKETNTKVSEKSFSKVSAESLSKISEELLTVILKESLTKILVELLPEVSAKPLTNSENSLTNILEESLTKISKESLTEISKESPTKVSEEPLTTNSANSLTKILEKSRMDRNNSRFLPVTLCRQCQKCESEKLSLSEEQKKITLTDCLDVSAFKSKPGFIDSHCHLDFLLSRQNYDGTYKDYMLEHKDTYPATYQGCVAVFCNPYTFKKKLTWQKYLDEEGVWGAFGCHPHNAMCYSDSKEEDLCAALLHPKVRALGEIGLDYSSRNYCTKEKQHEVLRRQLKLAVCRSLPLVIHCREADEDCMSIMKEILPKDYAIHLHCFTEGWERAQEWLREFPNLFIGITNLVTFNSAEPTHEVTRRISLKRLLLETDAPYFIPRKSRRNTRWSHPGMAIHVAAQIAALRNQPLAEVLYWTRYNTYKMYGI